MTDSPLRSPDDIQGWFDFQHIYDEAVRRATDGVILVEVGCWLGKSSAYLHKIAKASGKDITLVFVDTWKGELNQVAHTEVVQSLGGDMFPTWKANMESTGVDFSGTHPRIMVMQMTSTEAAATFPQHSIDFVFIDAAHDYVSVCADLRAWLAKLKPTGHIAGHDYGWHEVQKAVNEMLTVRSRDSSWERIPLP